MYKKAHRNLAIGSFIALPAILDKYNILYNFNYMFNNYTIIHIGILLLLTIFGATIPDWDLKLKYVYHDYSGKKQYLYHRQITHSLFIWILFGYLSYNLNNIYLFYFVVGVYTHLIADMLTGSIPILFYGRYYDYFSRIGLDRFYPKPSFWKKVAIWSDRISPLFVVVGIAIFILHFQLKAF